jgi:hypothetical protein
VDAFRVYDLIWYQQIKRQKKVSAAVIKAVSCHFSGGDGTTMVMQEEGFIRPTFMRLEPKSQNFLPTSMYFLDTSKRIEGFAGFDQLLLRLGVIRKTNSAEPKS